MQAILQEFDSVAAPNEDTMIRYFRKSFWLSIQAQLDVRHQDLDFWDEVVNKTINAEAKASLKAPSETKKIDSWYPRGQQLAKKDDKNSRNFEKNKFS